jgi:PhzF family phenazine biosynthesis protein
MPPLYVVDAFTDRAFAGNPAAVCLLDRWPTEGWLRSVGREMNLAETAFLVRDRAFDYQLRWFTPAVEVALCGHATLASAHALWENGHTPRRVPLTFHTKSGPLTATPNGNGEIELDFPARPASPTKPPAGLLPALGVKAAGVGWNGDDYLVVLKTAAAVRAVRPDFRKLAAVKCRGVIVTARSRDRAHDFVSRFFAPAAGIDEDPVTGSAHCCLAEYWGEKLGKDVMTGYQASARGGVVRVTRRGGRVGLGGRAVTVSRGELIVPPG